MSRTLEFFYDFSSPNAYFAHEQMGDHLPDADLDVVYRPVFLGGIFKELNTAPPVENNDLKAEYLWIDSKRWAQKYDIPYSRPSVFPMNSLPALRAVLVLEDQNPELVHDFVDRVFSDYWARDEDISNRTVLEDILRDLRIEPESILTEIEEESVKERLRERTNWALERGVFGVPMFIVDGDRFWGKDRLEFVQDALKHS